MGLVLYGITEENHGKLVDYSTVVYQLHRLLRNYVRTAKVLVRTSCVMGLVLSGITEENHGRLVHYPTAVYQLHRLVHNYVRTAKCWPELVVLWV
jgi:hypothetical protein